jgi:Fungal specific transcription factor domain
LSGAGTGVFISTMFKDDTISPSQLCPHVLDMNRPSCVNDTEMDTPSVVVELTYNITAIAVRLGLLSRQLRGNISFSTVNTQPEPMRTKMSQFQAFELQELLRKLWAASTVRMVSQQVEKLPTQLRRLFDHAFTFHRACIIYSHMSLWPRQGMDMPGQSDAEVVAAASDILKTAEQNFAEGQLDLRFLVFPLFMAGVSSIDGEQKQRVSELIRVIETGRIGSNTRTTRRALEFVYEKQMESLHISGQIFDVDWIDILAEKGLTVVNFGL